MAEPPTTTTCDGCSWTVEKHYTWMGLTLCLGLCPLCGLGLFIMHLLRANECQRCNATRFYASKPFEEYMLYQMYDSRESGAMDGLLPTPITSAILKASSQPTVSVGTPKFRT